MPGNFIHPDLTQAMLAIEQTQCVLTLDLEGRVLAVNDNYLDLCGYRREELIGNTLAPLMDASEPATQLPKDFWSHLRAGIPQTGDFKRFGRSGKVFWINATYTPIKDADGRVVQVGVFATDISAAKIAAEVAEHKVSSMSRGQAMIEFTPTGEILNANEIFLQTMGYTLNEIRGKHHRIFVHPDEAALAAYGEMWAALGSGETRSGEFRRIGKNGQDIWINGVYTAVLDDEGVTTSVMKLALDVTERHNFVASMIDALDKLRDGDLTYRMTSSTAEYRPPCAAYNATSEGLEAMIGEIRDRAGQMNDEAVQIARGADDLARRGETQAASLEETAAAVEQISGNISMTSQSAQQADAAARDALAVVLKGAAVVSEAIAAIERIDEHTKQMGEFTRVIEGFAFQTNLLSINAAVEAARAGEVGRGFAVVANEVRNLAQQSAKASHNIADLIAKSETEVKSGVRLARDAGASLDQIQAAVGGVVENITGIAHATTEQSTGVREVSSALAQLDSVNQANLSMSEQYASAAAALSSQVEELGGMMDRFRTRQVAPSAQTLGRRVA